MDQQKVTLFLTFPGKAEEAMGFYAEKLPGARVDSFVRYGDSAPAGMGAAEKVLHGELVYKGQTIMFMDMIGDCPDFSWAASIYVDCEDEADFDAMFAGLSQGGKVMMGPMAVGQLRKVAWITDRFGVTWQLVWA